MGDFANKLKSQKNIMNLTVSEKYSPASYQHAEVETMGGMKLNILASQIAPIDIHQNANMWRYTSRGDLTSCLSGGTQTLIQLDRTSGSGFCSDAVLRVAYQNNSGSASIMNVLPHWINNILVQSSDGKTIQQISGKQLWDLYGRMYSYEQWQLLAPLVNSNSIYGIGASIANGASGTLYLPILSSFLNTSAVFLPFINGDTNVYVQWNASSLNCVSGSPVTITALTLDVQMSDLPADHRSMYMAQFASKINQSFFPFQRSMQVPLTVNAGQTYQIQLSGIMGDVVFMDFTLRANVTSGSELRNYSRVANFQLLDSEQKAISGQQLITHDWNQKYMLPRYFAGQISQYKSGIYTYVFSAENSSPVHLILNGQKFGSYPMGSYEYLQFTAEQGGTNEVQTITPSGTSASGSYTITWATPYSSQTTLPLAYNTSAANIALAIQALPNFDGLVTVSQPFTATSTLTFSGSYANRDLSAKGYNIIVNTMNAQTSGNALVFFVNSISTAGVIGFTAGSYTIDICAYTTALLSVLPSHQFVTMNT